MAAFSLLITTPDDLDRGLGLFEQYPALGAFDAVLAAGALERGADALVSADRAFASVPGLLLIDPAAPAIIRLVGDRPTRLTHATQGVTPRDARRDPPRDPSHRSGVAAGFRCGPGVA